VDRLAARKSATVAIPGTLWPSLRKPADYINSRKYFDINENVSIFGNQLGEADKYGKTY